MLNQNYITQVYNATVWELLQKKRAVIDVYYNFEK